MSGFNMPPGVSPRDIPGNDGPELSEEEIKVDEILTALEERAADQLEEVRKIVGKLAAERDSQLIVVEQLKMRIEHLRVYTTHHPACAKVRARMRDVEGSCDCGLKDL